MKLKPVLGPFMPSGQEIDGFPGACKIFFRFTDAVDLRWSLHFFEPVSN